MEDRVKSAFIELGVIRGRRQLEKYGKHCSTIANFLLSAPDGTDVYKFAQALVGILRSRGCLLITPAVCSNRSRMEEALKRIEKDSPLDAENVLSGCRDLVRTYMSNGVFRSRKCLLSSPMIGLPAWFRVFESGFDPDIEADYMQDALEELAKDRKLAAYLYGRTGRERWRT